MTIDPHVRRFLNMVAVANPESGARSPAARRAGLLGLAGLALGEPIAMHSVEDLSIPGPGGPLIVRRYAPAAPGPSRPIGWIYFHGGGWVAGGLDTHDNLCRSLARYSGCVLFSVDYRLAPEHRFPAGLEDAVAAIDWIGAQADSLGVRPGRLVVGGDSAGANLACAALGVTRQRAAAAPRPPVELQVLLCPILDLAERRPSRHLFGENHFMDRAALDQDLDDYLGPGEDRHDWRISPIFAPNISQTPQSHLHLAEYDPFRDEGLSYAEKLAAVGVPVRHTVHAGMIHYFYALPKLIPRARGILQLIGEEVRAALA